MIWNIIDNRERKYRWERVNAVVEPTWHDNTCKDTDIAPEMDGEGIGYEERIGVSLRDAIMWAQSFHYAVTLYLYDEGRGITPGVPYVEFRERVRKMRAAQTQGIEAFGEDAPAASSRSDESPVAREGDALKE